MSYQNPLLTILDYQSTKNKVTQESSVRYNESIVDCLHAHHVEVTPSGCKISSVNMVFDYALPADVQFKTVKGLQDEISLALGLDAKVFRREDEGRVFSISVPRESRSYVGLRELVSSDEFKNAESPMTIAVGVDELAKNVVLDLAQAPHVLISGTTGSGKTVFLDDIILSLLYKASPKRVKLVLIDPAADLAVYSGLPHLLFPPVSEKSEAYEVIKYVRNRMDERYEILAQDGVRNIITYNENHKNNPMNNIVVIIDKYLEYTYEMPSDFIECIKEIARKGRAAGIHLIINAQSARSEVVNNDVKANMPCRIAFSVTDWHESKAILDKTGAQKLLGNGDMLYSPSLNGNPKHIQAPYVSLREIAAVVSDTIQRNGVAEYVRDFDDVREPVEDNVPYVISILERLLQVNTVDVYSLQDMLDISYAEASDIIKFMELNGVVSGYDAGKGRNVNHAQIESLLDEFKSLNSVPDEDDQN